MPRRLRLHVPGGFYHVTLRGNHRQNLFARASDRSLLNRIVARAIAKYDARVHAYCWMSNHLHFLIQVGIEPLARPMQQIASEFARAMQIKIETTGHFFERRYHATLVEAADYLFTALRYIHRNPVDAGIVSTPDEYRWSNHHAYVGRRKEPWVTTTFILGKFGDEPRRAVRSYEEFMAREPGDGTPAFPEGAFIFGSDDFIERIRGSTAGARSMQPLDDLIAEACQRFALTREQLATPRRDRYLGRVRAWIAHQAAVRGVANRSEVARALGRSEGTLRAAVQRYWTGRDEPGCDSRESREPQPGTTDS